MKKILFLVTKSINGGAQKWTKEQIEICSEHFECSLATDTNGWLSQNTIVKNLFLNNLIHKRFSFTYLMELAKFIEKQNIDLLIASSANAGLYARLATLFNKNLKVIYVSHGWSSIYNGGRLTYLYNYIERQLSRLTDSVLCVSKKDAEDAKNIIHIDKYKVTLITNKIYPVKKTKEILKKHQTLKILTVARLCNPKRVDLLMKAVDNLDVELHIIGDGDLRKELEAMSFSNVYFHGEINNFQDFAAYDIFALISESEGLPLSALEAMSVGLPLILSDVGGCSVLIKDNGKLVNNNIQEIKNALLFCTNNKEKFSHNSIKLFDEEFNLEKYKEKYLNYYHEILE